MLDGWKPDLLVAVPLAASLTIYSIGLTRVRVPRLEVTAFLSGWLVLFVSLLSPIATISETLFSMHMTQHELLMLVAAPLITLGRPLVPMMWALPAHMRRRLKGGAGLSRTWSRLTSPPVVFALHAMALWVWHVPALYQAAVRDDRVHMLQHVMFTGTACLFWWGMLRGRYGRLGYGAAVFYVFATAMHSGGLGALITFATAPLYPLYVERANGVDPLVDQQLAGLIMWIPAGVVLMIFGLALLSAWLGEAERRGRLLAMILIALGGATLSASPMQTPREVSIVAPDPKTLGDYGMGVMLGAQEAERAALLLGHRFRLATTGPGTARVAPLAPGDGDLPTVAMKGVSSNRCTFITGSPEDVRRAKTYLTERSQAHPGGSPPVDIADWHPAFRRYGASELNERFAKTFGRQMTSDAWHGWVAVKAIAEAAVRGNDVCAELTRLRFDGHKGRALRFDPQTRHLRHPSLLIEQQAGREVVEVVP